MLPNSGGQSSIFDERLHGVLKSQADMPTAWWPYLVSSFLVLGFAPEPMPLFLS
jgi:hypothetical protein